MYRNNCATFVCMFVRNDVCRLYDVANKQNQCYYFDSSTEANAEVEENAIAIINCQPNKGLFALHPHHLQPGLKREKNCNSYSVNR